MKHGFSYGVAALLIGIVLVGGWWVGRQGWLQTVILGEWHFIESVDKTGSIFHDPYGQIPYIFYVNGHLEVRHPFIGGLSGTYQVLDNQHIELFQSDALTGRIIEVKIAKCVADRKSVPACHAEPQ
jgi:hypothetical protein